MQNKTTLRQFYRDLRRNISQEKKLSASQSIIQIFSDFLKIDLFPNIPKGGVIASAARQSIRDHRIRWIASSTRNDDNKGLENTLMFKRKKIAVYLAHDGELDLQLFIQQLWQQDAAVFLPVVDPQTNRLRFAYYIAATVMQKNIYDINEPQTDIFVMPLDLDIVLMPLVAFDKTGARLGMGKGYYDKSFAFRGDARKPLLIGVAYECQCGEKLPMDEWDVPLDGVMTEKELMLFSEIR